MSQENVELVQRAIEAYNRRDLDAVLGGTTDDFVQDWSRTIGPNPNVYRGRDEVRGFLESWWGAFDQAAIHVDEIIDAGDSVVVVFHARVRGRESGAEARGPGAVQVWTVRGGLASSLTLYQGRDEALEAVGLRE
jgi:ketosteroid isomerase-like protein